MGYYESDLQIVKTLISTQQTEEAARLLQHLIRQRPDGEAYAMLGDLYSLGKGVEQNSDKACECFENAAKMGHADAMRATAEMNYRGGLLHKPSFPAKYCIDNFHTLPLPHSATRSNLSPRRLTISLLMVPAH